MDAGYLSNQNSAVVDALYNYLFCGRITPAKADGWRIQRVWETGELEVDHLGRKVELTFKIRKNEGEVTLINTHRLSKNSRRGHGSTSLVELEDYLRIVGEQKHLGVRVQFMINAHWWNKQYQTRNWVMRNGYTAIEGSKDTLYEKIVVKQERFLDK